MNASLQKNRIASSLAPRFAFSGGPGQVLQTYFEKDVASSQLSRKYKLYYRLRPWIPISLRQRLQRSQNQSRQQAEDWYIHKSFWEDFRSAISADGNQPEIHPWPDQYRTCAALTHDVETSQGLKLIDRVASIEEEYGLRSCWNFVAHKYKIDSGILTSLKQRGHEIGVHGYNHDGRLFESERMFRRRTRPINKAIVEFGSSGFRSPMVHRNLVWQQALEVQYDASCFDCDPFQAMAGGVGGIWPFICGNFVELPYTLPQDHTLLITLAEMNARIWLDKLRHLRACAGMAMPITHPDYLDTPARLDIYRELLENLIADSDCWHALPHQVAAWWRDRDQMSIDTSLGQPEVKGPSSERAKLFSLLELLDDEQPQTATPR